MLKRRSTSDPDNPTHASIKAHTDSQLNAQLAQLVQHILPHCVSFTLIYIKASVRNWEEEEERRRVDGCKKGMRK